MNGGGLFCANFYCKRGPFAPCKSCWCGSCYEPSNLIEFLRQTPVDDDGVDQRLVGDELCFLEARNGDNFITPFQCDTCHFRNILGREPVRRNFKDYKILPFVRRANLDALWAQEPNTVMANLREAVRMEKFTSQLGLPSVTPPMGPYLLRDEFGMLAALATFDEGERSRSTFQARCDWENKESSTRWEVFWNPMCENHEGDRYKTRHLGQMTHGYQATGRGKSRETFREETKASQAHGV
jgi:hypothetical protein